MASQSSSKLAVPIPRRAGTEARARESVALESLQRARNLLRPDDVAGEYDASRLLATTLGGHLRPITHEDLRTFEANVRKLGRRFTGGITPKAVIDMSLRVDRERANREIPWAAPMSLRNGVVHFSTAASGKNGDTRHHVHVEFLNFAAAVASPANSAVMANECVKGRVRYKCDCGRHLYWFSYICTVGKFIYGAPQQNFPKIRNPKLVGVACKHVLRVMQQLSTPIIKQQIEKMIESARKPGDDLKRILSKKEAEKIALQQREQAEWKRNQVETSAEKRQRLAQQRAVQAVVARARIVPSAKLTPRAVATAKKQFEINARKLASLGIITDKQLQAMLGKLG